MKHITFMLIILAFSGCVTPGFTGFGSAELVSMKFKPKKAGVVKTGYSPNDKIKATQVMNQFCAPQIVEIIEINESSVATGSKAFMAFGVLHSRPTSEEVRIISFDCNDAAQAASE